jgi:hypothetical protein
MPPKKNNKKSKRAAFENEQAEEKMFYQQQLKNCEIFLNQCSSGELKKIYDSPSLKMSLVQFPLLSETDMKDLFDKKWAVSGPVYEQLKNEFEIYLKAFSYKDLKELCVKKFFCGKVESYILPKSLLEKFSNLSGEEMKIMVSEHWKTISVIYKEQKSEFYDYLQKLSYTDLRNCSVETLPDRFPFLSVNKIHHSFIKQLKKNMCEYQSQKDKCAYYLGNCRTSVMKDISKSSTFDSLSTKFPFLPLDKIKKLFNKLWNQRRDRDIRFFKKTIKKCNVVVLFIAVKYYMDQIIRMLDDLHPVNSTFIPVENYFEKYEKFDHNKFITLLTMPEAELLTSSEKEEIIKNQFHENYLDELKMVKRKIYNFHYLNIADNKFFTNCIYLSSEDIFNLNKEQCCLDDCLIALNIDLELFCHLNNKDFNIMDKTIMNNAQFKLNFDLNVLANPDPAFDFDGKFAYLEKYNDLSLHTKNMIVTTQYYQWQRNKKTQIIIPFDVIKNIIEFIDFKLMIDYKLFNFAIVSKAFYSIVKNVIIPIPYFLKSAMEDFCLGTTIDRPNCQQKIILNEKSISHINGKKLCAYCLGLRVYGGRSAVPAMNWIECFKCSTLFFIKYDYNGVRATCPPCRCKF